MPGKAKDTKRDVAAEVWRLLFGFIIKTRFSRDVVLAELGISPVDAKALHGLSLDAGKPMGALATEWACDASNATWMVDRLEQHGLAERQVSPTDRRVKLVTLTKRGAVVRKMLMERMMEPPDDLLKLTRSDLDALLNALRKLPTVDLEDVHSHGHAAGDPEHAHQHGALNFFAGQGPRRFG